MASADCNFSAHDQFIRIEEAQFRIPDISGPFTMSSGAAPPAAFLQIRDQTSWCLDYVVASRHPAARLRASFSFFFVVRKCSAMAAM